MDNPDSIKFYINATWYPGTADDRSNDYIKFKNETKWTDEGIANFFSLTDTSSFGYALAW